MDSDANIANLEGKLLVAMPGMGDPRFEKSVVFLCSHDDEGAMGLIVNKALTGQTFSDLLRQLDVPAGDRPVEVPVHFGGPVESQRGFILHSGDYDGNASTLSVGAFGMTATLDILEDIARGDGPSRALLALGYSGWGPGQLEEEILANGWLTCDATPALVFDQDPAAAWEAALKSLGIDALMLSASAGHA